MMTAYSVTFQCCAFDFVNSCFCNCVVASVCATLQSSGSSHGASIVSQTLEPYRCIQPLPKERSLERKQFPQRPGIATCLCAGGREREERSTREIFPNLLEGLSDMWTRYLTGNFAPIQQTRSLTPCTYTGSIPEELAGGQYVRNGGNPVSNEDLGRDAHWFDGDGMLSGVSFSKDEKSDTIKPSFVNQYILTDVYLSAIATSSLKKPILPSISTLVNPAASLLKVCLHIFRTIVIVLLSWLAGSRHRIKKISVANTSILYHDGRALATCESGPPIRVQLPDLETVGWYCGDHAEGEAVQERAREKFGGDGLIGFMKEWTTGHPKVDPFTKEMILYHGTFIAPYVQYSVIPERKASQAVSKGDNALPRLLNAPVPGVSGAKMMHDFGVSKTHTIIMDLPLTLDPLNLVRNLPIVSYKGEKPSRFGVFPRRDPELVRWFETKACCIFHTANTWDNLDNRKNVTAVNMLACRLTSASLVFSAANLDVCRTISGHVKEPKKPMPFFESYEYDEAVLKDGDLLPSPSLDRSAGYEHAPDLECPATEKTPLLGRNLTEPPPITSIDNVEAPSPELETEQCRLYYFKFNLNSTGNEISRQYALSILPFEFPSLNPTVSMQEARYIYGCSTSTLTSFGTALGKAAKIDVLLKIDALALIAQGEANSPAAITGSVDIRTLPQVLVSKDANDPIKAFVMPDRWFAQEPRFVPCKHAKSEDDGYLLFYAFDEAQLDAEGEAPRDAVSELWILDAAVMGKPGVGMQAVIGRVRLPQRVPYGLHGTWFSEQEIEEQRPVESLRSVAQVLEATNGEQHGRLWGSWMQTRKWAENLVG